MFTRVLRRKSKIIKKNLHINLTLIKLFPYLYNVETKKGGVA